MRKILCILLALLICSQVSMAFAKREANLSDYNTAADFFADIELGTRISFDALLTSTTEYVDEDSYCISYPLISWYGSEYNPLIGIYARQEDLGDIHASSGLGGKEREYHFVHVEGIADAAPKYDSVFIYIIDGQGSIELIDPEATTYCLNDEKDVEAFKKKARNGLDIIEIKDGIVTKTDDTQVKLNHYQVWISCGEFEIYIQTPEKQFFIDDKVCGTGRYQSFTSKGSVMLYNANISLVN